MLRSTFYLALTLFRISLGLSQFLFFLTVSLLFSLEQSTKNKYLSSRWLNKLQTKISEHAVFDSVLGQESAHTPVLWILLGPGGRILSLRQDKNSQEGGLARYQHIAAGLFN